MPNLIEQMNILKGLTDEHLQGEVSAPSGSVPPYLVLTELNRRKDVRQRYEGEAARRKQRTTVAEDLVPASTGAPGMAPMAAPGGGLDAAGMGAPMAAPAPVGFASGGLVDDSEIADKDQKKLDGLGGSPDNARAMALLAASAGILGGGSSNTLKNVGAGISAGLTSYQDQMKLADQEETDLLRSLLDVGQAQSALDLSREDRDFRERELAQNQTQFDTRMSQDKKPADVIAFEYRKTLSPEDRAEYDRLNPAYNPNSLTNDLRVADKIDQIYEDAQKKYPVKEYDNPEDATAKQQKARMEAYQRIKAAYGAIYADEWATGIGLAPGDLVLGGVGGGVIDTKDPLGLGL